MATGRALACLTLLTLTCSANGFLDEALDVIKLGKDIGEDILNSWDVLGKPFNATGGVEIPLIRRKEREVLSRLAQISRTIQKLELGLEKAGVVTMLLAKTSGRGPKLELRLHELADLLSRISNSDKHMREYVGLQQELERSTLEDFAQWCVSHDSSALPGLLERVYSLIVPPHNNLLGRGLMQLTLDDLQVCGLFCLFTCNSTDKCNFTKKYQMLAAS